MIFAAFAMGAGSRAIAGEEDRDVRAAAPMPIDLGATGQES